MFLCFKSIFLKKLNTNQLIQVSKKILKSCKVAVKIIQNKRQITGHNKIIQGCIFLCFKNIFKKIYLNMMMLKINFFKYYFNIFLNKKYFKK